MKKESINSPVIFPHSRGVLRGFALAPAVCEAGQTSVLPGRASLLEGRRTGCLLLAPASRLLVTLASQVAAVAVVLNCSFLIHSCSAAEVNFVPNGDSNSGVVKGEAPVNMLGTMPLRNGSLVLNDKVASLKAATDFAEAPRTLLAGSVLRTEATGSGGNASVTAVIMFLMGEWMRLIDDESQIDVIFKTDGQVRGRILGRDGDAIVVQQPDGKQRPVPLATVLYIRSPRVFVFTAKARLKAPVEKDSPFSAEVTSASIRPTGAPRSISLSSVVPRPAGEDAPPGTGNSALSPVQFFEDEELPAPAQPKVKQHTPFVPSWLPQ